MVAFHVSAMLGFWRLSCFLHTRQYEDPKRELFPEVVNLKQMIANFGMGKEVGIVDIDSADRVLAAVADDATTVSCTMTVCAALPADGRTLHPLFLSTLVGLR